MIPIKNPARALVITHGAIAEELKNVVEMILGPTEGLEAMSNSGKSAPDITQAVSQWLDQVNKGSDNEPQPSRQAIILIDDYGGSCATAAQLAVKNRPEVAIISGVNLAMLLGFVTWRESSDFNELVRKVVQKGREAITLLGAR